MVARGLAEFVPLDAAEIAKPRDAISLHQALEQALDLIASPSDLKQILDRAEQAAFIVPIPLYTSPKQSKNMLKNNVLPNSIEQALSFLDVQKIRHLAGLAVPAYMPF